MKKLLLQLDSDKHPSSFDRIVGYDAGADEVLSYGNVTPEDVSGLIQGAFFTRSIPDLKNTAIWIGGSNVSAGEALLQAAQTAFFGPFQVSLMLDSNGSNTTAATAVFVASTHVDLSACTALVLGGTGPVGQRAARLLAEQGATVKLASRSLARAQAAAEAINDQIEGTNVSGVQTASEAETAQAVVGISVIIAAGAAGAQLIAKDTWATSADLKVLIDLNAVPPLGIEGVELTDKASETEGKIVYGAIGVGGTKMKVHKACIARLFESNDLVLDATGVYEVAQALLGN